MAVDETERKELELSVQHALNVLADNMLRLMAGGGKPYELSGQLFEVLIAFKNYNAAGIGLPLGKLVERYLYHALKVQDRLIERKQSSFEDETMYVASVIQYAMRIAAADYVWNPSQKTSAEFSFYDALRNLARKREELHPRIRK
jgi:hypothetical protein